MGYGSQYEHDTLKALEKAKLIPPFKYRTKEVKGCDPITVQDESGWQYMERNKITFHSEAHYGLKRDL